MLNNRAIELQITSYLAGECTPSEQQAIAGLIQSDGVYRNTYHAMKQIWATPVLSPVSDTYDVDAAWLLVSKHIKENPLSVVRDSQKPKPMAMRFVKYAAGIAAMLLIAFSVFYIAGQNKPLKSVASGPDASSAVLLSDGSNITLNLSSQVKFPEKFGSDRREVYFWGEAFFEIASDPTRPFVIETGDARIKVLGTAFNVKADPITGLTEVVVNSGTVLFYHVDKNNNIRGQIVLRKGDKGVYNTKTHTLAMMPNDDPNFISWKTGMLVFNETTLDKVMEVVGKKYDVHFRMNNAELSHLKLTATFDNESLDSVLEVLSLVHKLQFTHNGKDYLVKKVTG